MVNYNIKTVAIASAIGTSILFGMTGCSNTPVNEAKGSAPYVFRGMASPTYGREVYASPESVTEQACSLAESYRDNLIANDVFGLVNSGFGIKRALAIKLSL
jgi:hypothetical protein